MNPPIRPSRPQHPSHRVEGSPESSARLDYAPPPPLANRAGFRRAIFWIALAALLISAIASGPRIWRRAVLIHRQNQCLSYSSGPRQIVFELLKDQDFDFTAVAARDRFIDAMDQRRWAAVTLFCHQRSRPDGKRRLVIIEMNGPQISGPGAGHRLEPTALIAVSVYEIGSMLQPPRLLSDGQLDVLQLSPVPFRLFAGQADPADLSHFTIDFTAAGQRRAINGWLLDNDSVRLDFPPSPPVAGATSP